MKIYNKRYKELAELGQGAYGKIHLAEDIRKPQHRLPQAQDNIEQYVAIKKMKIDKVTGIDSTSIRELKIMKEIRHPNIIKLKDVFVEQDDLFMALEYMVCDLEKLIDTSSVPMNNKDIKLIFKHIVDGVHHLHGNWILHRDLKPGNILVGIQGNLKITDFGLARYHADVGREMTPGVVTRWYRAPEVLFGTRFYGKGVDVWALGCILAELYLRTPLFKGETDIDQLSKIFGIRGTPSDSNWPGVSSLPFCWQFEKRDPIMLKRIIPNIPDEAIDLIESMLQLNPKNRPSTAEILAHPFMENIPLPSEVDFIKHLESFKHSKITLD